VNRRRTADLAFLLPWVGAFLLTPPMVIILQTWARVSGFPLFILYLFICWLLLIVAGGIVAALLPWHEDARARRDGAIVRESDDG
jgi:hypothetical protein